MECSHAGLVVGWECTREIGDRATLPATRLHDLDAFAEEAVVEAAAEFAFDVPLLEGLGADGDAVGELG